MLSVCITVKNRSRLVVEGHELVLLPNCVRSLVGAVGSDVEAELVVADWDSDDWPLDEWLIDAAAPIPVRIVRVEGQFSRGRGRNVAADAAVGDDLLFSDADSLLSRTLIERGRVHLAQGRAFFPVLFSFDSPAHDTGWWRHEGFGNCMVTRAVFERAGRWPDYGVWGREDDDFHARVERVAEVVREEVPGFFHQWHPEDVLWKDRYGDAAALAEIRRARDVVATLAELVPDGDCIVLADEARFGIEVIGSRPVRPFLELNGEYGGVPADGSVAVEELARARAEGARYFAVTWIAFWWLEHYPALAQHLGANHARILDTEDVILFDLR